MKDHSLIFGAFVLGLVVAAVIFIDDARRTERVVVWHPGEISTFVDPLYPPGRWLKAEGGEQVMNEEPGYTNIRLVRKYRTLKLVVKFENPDTVPVSIGMRLADGSMDLRPSKDGGFEGIFEMSGLQNDRGRAQMIISAPKLREGAAPLAFKEITVIYAR